MEMKYLGVVVLDIALVFLAIVPLTNYTNPSSSTVVYHIPMTATVVSNKTPTAPEPTSPINILNLILVITSVLSCIGIRGLVKWLLWRRKYGRVRTPIVVGS